MPSPSSDIPGRTPRDRVPAKRSGGIAGQAHRMWAISPRPAAALRPSGTCSIWVPRLLFDDAEVLADPQRTDPDKHMLILAGNRKGVALPLKNEELMGDGTRDGRTPTVRGVSPRCACPFGRCKVGRSLFPSWLLSDPDPLRTVTRRTSAIGRSIGTNSSPICGPWP